MQEVVDDTKKKSVRVSIAGKKPESPVGPKASKIKIAGVKIIDAVQKGGTAKPSCKAKVKKAKSKTSKSIVLRKSDACIIGTFDGDIQNLPSIFPEFASIRPCDPKAFAVLEQAVIRDGVTGKKSKAAAGSALSQTKAPKKQTSSKAASAASKVLRDKRTSKGSKSAAGSALSQTPKRKK